MATPPAINAAITTERENKSTRLGDGQAVPHHAPQQAAIEPDDGQDGAELDDDFEGGGAGTHESERVARQDQVAGRRDGQELRRALDQPEDDRREDGWHGFKLHHARSRTPRRPAPTRYRLR